MGSPLSFEYHLVSINFHFWIDILQANSPSPYISWSVSQNRKNHKWRRTATPSVFPAFPALCSNHLGFCSCICFPISCPKWAANIVKTKKVILYGVKKKFSAHIPRFLDDSSFTLSDFSVQYAVSSKQSTQMCRRESIGDYQFDFYILWVVKALGRSTSLQVSQ